MSSHKNRVKMTVTGTPGTGTITLSAASSGYQSLATAYGANATVDVLITEGTAWEVARDCAYTHSGTTLSRGTLEESSTGSAVSFTSAAVVSVIATADRGRTWDSAALNTQATGTDANTTMAVNTMYVVDMSAWATADRTYTLPATAAVGDRVGVMVTAGDATHELILTAGTGDTLNGIAGGTEWSRLFITNEVVVMRCIVANATWVVEYDGRIPQEGLMDLTTASDGETANTYFRPTQTSTAGVWTSRIDVGGVVSTANDYMLVRRAGKFQVSLGYAPKDTGTTGVAVNARMILNDTQEEAGPSATCTASAVNRCAASKLIQMAAGDYVRYQYRTADGSIGCAAFRGSFLSIFEVLP